LKTAPTQPEPVIQGPSAWDIVAEFLNEIGKMGGLKLNVNCKKCLLILYENAKKFNYT